MKKYIILGNGTGWCYNCWKSAIDNKRIRFINEMMPTSKKGILKAICFNHNRFRIPLLGIRTAPFLRIWYKDIERTLNIDVNSETFIIIYDWNFLTKDFAFLDYIRSKYENVKFIYLFSNIIKVTGATYYGILKDIKSKFDAVFAFDRRDAEKFNFEHNYLIYAANNSITSSESYSTDLFYVGRAKDRYKMLIEIFEKAQSEGLKCDFNIVGVPEKKQMHKGIINYSPLPYKEVLNRIMSSRCLVDAIQGNSTAMTIKVCESVIFNKKLITTNENIKLEPFYNKDRILIYSENHSLREFVYGDYMSYTEEDKFLFSPEHLFDEINKVLA